MVKPYGGVRVNTNLLWSQVLSLNGDQLLRGIYLVGEGDNRADFMELDPKQFALGNNLLGSYDLVKDNQSRVSIYYRQQRRSAAPTPTTRRDAAQIDDQLNFSTPSSQNGPDVYSVAGWNNVQSTNFCFASKPSNQDQHRGLQLAVIRQRFCLSRQPRLPPEAERLGPGHRAAPSEGRSAIWTPTSGRIGSRCKRCLPGRSAEDVNGRIFNRLGGEGR